MMLHKSCVLLAAVAALSALPANAGGLYTKSSPVLQVDAKNYNQLIAKSNQTSILEFYAPWCGHCQSLKPAYEKAAKSLDGLAKVAAINCDDEENKVFCGQMGVQGFPTLKIVTPSKKVGKPNVEDYQGARSAKAIVDAVVDRIPNHVKKVTDKSLDEWLGDTTTPKAILFTEKGTTSALLRSLAIDFLGAISFGQIRNKETAAVEKFNIEKSPTLVLIQAEAEEPLVYSGELKKQPMLEFLRQAAEPNPDPAPAASGKANKSKSKSKAAKSASSSAAPEDDSDATETPTAAKPSETPLPPPINVLDSPEALESACLTPKSHTCVLALLPAVSDPSATEDVAKVAQALYSLAEISHKLHQRSANMFPFYAVPATNVAGLELRHKLGLSTEDDDKEAVTETEIVALNGRRGWWRRFETSGDGEFRLAQVEAWIDGIRLGEGSKQKLPEGVLAEKKEEKVQDEDKTKHQEL